MRACAAQLFGTPDLRGRSMAIVGLGQRRRRAWPGAWPTRAPTLHVLGHRPPQAWRSPRELGAHWLEPQEALAAEVDILAPCALGGMLDDERVQSLRCRAVCGAANNQLAHDGVADRLAARGILYAPDFIVNAGGLINVSLELTGYDPALAARRSAEIEAVLTRVLDHAHDAGMTPLRAAGELAQRWLSAAAAASGRAPRPAAGAPGDGGH